MKLLLTSPMRTGSTWVYEILTLVTRPEVTGFVSTAGEAVEICSAHSSCVLKSHRIIDLDFPTLPPDLTVIRLLRNYKDSVASRALYCRNIRSVEGLPIDVDEQELIMRLTGLSDREFVNRFLGQTDVVSNWLEEHVVHERGRCENTLYYEMLHYDAFEQITTLLNNVSKGKLGLSTQLARVLKEKAIGRMKATKTSALRRSVGVGGWMWLLDPPVVEFIDEMYRSHLTKITRAKCERFPVSRRLLHSNI